MDLVRAQHDIATHTGKIIYLDISGMIRAPVEIRPMTRTAGLVEQAYKVISDCTFDVNARVGKSWRTR